MQISLITQADSRGVKHSHRATMTPKLPPFTNENRPLFKMAYLYLKNEESYDGFKKMVGR